jgi:hypothetical protein
MNKSYTVKWAGPNTPLIRANDKDDDTRIYLSKIELIQLRDEIDSFIEYYKESFTKETINNTDFNGDDIEENFEF